MIVYNLTDRTPPWEKTPRTAQPVKLFGKLIPAGEFMEFSIFPLRAVTGLISSHTISVDNLPEWYQKIGSDKRMMEAEVGTSLAEEKPRKRSRKSRDDR
jgi:hypothetical protein